MLGVDGATKRIAPESGSLVHIGGLAVDQNGAEARMMHISALTIKPLNSSGAMIMIRAAKSPSPLTSTRPRRAAEAELVWIPFNLRPIVVGGACYFLACSIQSCA